MSIRGITALALVVVVLGAGVWGYAIYKGVPDGLLPDVVPVPPRDLQVATTSGGGTELLFSTTYYNQGAGPLELRFDESVRLRGDTERPVYQRIMGEGGVHEDKQVGIFLWHNEHKHYHFADFVMYKFERLSHEPEVLVDNIKATFCLRDVTRALLDIPNKSAEGEYKTCGREVQGASIGWGETYYFDYPGQNFDISGKPAGRYRLTTTLNPDRYLYESDYRNNTSSVTFDLDPAAMTVSNVVESPDNAPEVEHVRLMNPFGITPAQPAPAESTSTQDTTPAQKD